MGGRAHEHITGRGDRSLCYMKGVFQMKLGKLLSVMLILCLLLSACGVVTERHTDYFGFDVADFIRT